MLLTVFDAPTFSGCCIHLFSDYFTCNFKVWEGAAHWDLFNNRFLHNGASLWACSISLQHNLIRHVTQGKREEQHTTQLKWLWKVKMIKSLKKVDTSPSPCCFGLIRAACFRRIRAVRSCRCRSVGVVWGPPACSADAIFRPKPCRLLATLQQHNTMSPVPGLHRFVHDEISFLLKS